MITKDEQLKIASTIDTSSEVLAELAKSEYEDVRAEVAGNFNTPEATLIELANDSCDKVRNYLATNPCVPYEALAWLAASRHVCGWAPAFHLWANPAWPYKDEELLPYWDFGGDSLECDEYLYARDPDTHDSLLEYIYMNAQMDITLIELARNLRTPAWCLQEIARDAESETLQALASNPAIPVELLTQIAKQAIDDQDFCVVSEVSRNPNTSSTLLDSILETFKDILTPEDEPLDSDALDVLIGMAANPKTSPEILSKISYILLESLQENELVEDDDEDQHEHGLGSDRYDAEPIRKFVLSPRTLVGALLNNAQTPPTVLNSLNSLKFEVVAEEEIEAEVNLSDNSREMEALNPNTSPTRLRELMEAGEFYICASVALNRNASTLLGELSKDSNPDIRKSVAINPICSEEILAELFKDEETEVKVAVLLNSHTPLSILEEAASDDDLKSYVARHPKVTPSILEILMENGDAKIRDYIAQNPMTPGEILSILAEDPEEQVRCSVALNPNVGEETLVNLSLDESQLVRTMAFYNPSASDEIRITATLRGISEQPADSHLVRAINFLRNKKKIQSTE